MVKARPDGVWRVTRPDEEAQRVPFVSSKVIVVAEKFKRR